MKRPIALLFCLLMITMPLTGCIGGEEVDTSKYEDEVVELEGMLEMQNQTIAQREATIDGLEDGLSDATQMIQDYQEGIAILETYRDSLLVQLDNSNNTSAELIVELESANMTIELIQSQIISLENLRDSLQIELLAEQNVTSAWRNAAVTGDYQNLNMSWLDLSYDNFENTNFSNSNLLP